VDQDPEVAKPDPLPTDLELGIFALKILLVPNLSSRQVKSEVIHRFNLVGSPVKFTIPVGSFSSDPDFELPDSVQHGQDLIRN
jgi:hypothetical protein